MCTHWHWFWKAEASSFQPKVYSNEPLTGENRKKIKGAWCKVQAVLKGKRSSIIVMQCSLNTAKLGNMAIKFTVERWSDYPLVLQFLGRSLIGDRYDRLMPSKWEVIFQRKRQVWLHSRREQASVCQYPKLWLPFPHSPFSRLCFDLFNFQLLCRDVQRCS